VELSLGERDTRMAVRAAALGKLCITPAPVCLQ